MEPERHRLRVEYDPMVAGIQVGTPGRAGKQRTERRAAGVCGCPVSRAEGPLARKRSSTTPADCVAERGNGARCSGCLNQAAAFC